MCYRKKLLRNRVLPEHASGFDKYFIKAPCGCCPSCKKVKSNDWLVRSYFEFLNNNRQAFFVSLDFDDFHLPRYHGIPCFDSNLMKHFLQRIRNHIGKFRYFYASEYGGLLHRPHYHILICPDNYISKASFLDVIRRTWQQGHYTDIESLDSVNNNKLKAISYITEYVSKDITWDIPDGSKDMPLRFRPRTQASKGFGLQALELGYITPEMVLNGSRVTIPLGKNGTLKSFPIPRYYEMKLGYDYIWHADKFKAELIKNQFGVNLSINRHNVHYIYYITSLFSSRHENMSNFCIDTSSLRTSWKEAVYSCLDNRSDFEEFVYYRPFITLWTSSYYVKDNIRNELLYRPTWSFYNYVCSIYDKYNDYLAQCKDKLETEKSIISAKKRAWAKIRRKPTLYRYLVRKNFDFSLLKFY